MCMRNKKTYFHLDPFTLYNNLSINHENTSSVEIYSEDLKRDPRITR